MLAGPCNHERQRSDRVFISSRQIYEIEMSKSVCYFKCNGAEIVQSDAFPLGTNSKIGEKLPDHAIITDKDCAFGNIDDQSQLSNVGSNGGLKNRGADLNEESNQQPIESHSQSVTEMGDKDEKPKIRRKRSSSLSSLVLLKQVLAATDGDQYERIKLRRVSSIPCTYGSGTAEDTQLEDGLLTTTFCSTEL